MVRLFIVDDHQLFRSGIQVLMNRVDDIAIVGESACGTAAVKRVQTLSPDVILLDQTVPGEACETTVQQLESVCPTAAVLIMTLEEGTAARLAALRAGAWGYVSKGASHDEMIGAVRAASAGTAMTQPETALPMGAYFGGAQLDPAVVGVTLSRREREILRHIHSGSDTATIARRLRVTPKTTRNYISKIIKKLKADSRCGAAKKAAEYGLI